MSEEQTPPENPGRDSLISQRKAGNNIGEMLSALSVSMPDLDAPTKGTLESSLRNFYSNPANKDLLLPVLAARVKVSGQNSSLQEIAADIKAGKISNPTQAGVAINQVAQKFQKELSLFKVDTKTTAAHPSQDTTGQESSTSETPKRDGQQPPEQNIPPKARENFVFVKDAAANIENIIKANTPEGDKQKWEAAAPTVARLFKKAGESFSAYPALQVSDYYLKETLTEMVNKCEDIKETDPAKKTAEIGKRDANLHIIAAGNMVKYGQLDGNSFNKHKGHDEARKAVISDIIGKVQMGNYKLSDEMGKEESLRKSLDKQSSGGLIVNNAKPALIGAIIGMIAGLWVALKGFFGGKEEAQAEGQEQGQKKSFLSSPTAKVVLGLALSGLTLGLAYKAATAVDPSTGQSLKDNLGSWKDRVKSQAKKGSPGLSAG